MYLEHLKNKFENKPCYIVGKGYSLNRVTRNCFQNTKAPIIVIGEAIRIIENLNLSNKLISLQKDTFSVVDVKYSTQLLLHVHESAMGVHCSIKELFDNIELGLEITDFSAHSSIRIGQLMGCTEFIFVSFDSVTHKDFRSLSGTLPTWWKNYIIQAELMKKFTNDLNCKWITP